MDDRGGAQHAGAFYEEWEFAKKAVELYAAAVSWKGLTVFAIPEGEENGVAIGEISEATLRDVLPQWIVTGQTEVTLNYLARSSEPSERKQATLTLLTPWQSGGERGATLLWPACSNHEALIEMRNRFQVPMARELVSLMLGFAHRDLALPEWALDPVQARAANSEMVTVGLHFFRLRVDQWRDTISGDVENELRDTVSKTDNDWKHVYAAWNATWSPENRYEGWEALYEAFATRGFMLEGFASEYASTLRGAVDGGLFPRSVLTGWERLGF